MRRGRRIVSGPVHFQADFDTEKRVFKGDPQSYDLFRDAVRRLRENPEVKISMIRGTDLEKDLNIVQSATAVLYERPEQYRSLIEIIEQQWGGFPGDGIKHDTIAAQMIGCLRCEKACDAKCAGKAVQKPVNEQNACDVTVVIAQMKDDGVVDFQILNSVKNASNGEAMITYIGTFDGFTKSEKDTLRQVGFNKIKLNDANGEITSNFVPLDQIKTRTYQNTSNGSNTTNNNLTWLWVILGLGLLLLILWFLFKRKK